MSTNYIFTISVNLLQNAINNIYKCINCNHFQTAETCTFWEFLETSKWRKILFPRNSLVFLLFVICNSYTVTDILFPGPRNSFKRASWFWEGNGQLSYLRWISSGIAGFCKSCNWKDSVICQNFLEFIVRRSSCFSLGNFGRLPSLNWVENIYTCSVQNMLLNGVNIIVYLKTVWNKGGFLNCSHWR